MDDRQARGGGVFCVFITMTMGFQVVTWEIADFVSFERFSIVFCPRKKKRKKKNIKHANFPSHYWFLCQHVLHGL